MTTEPPGLLLAIQQNDVAAAAAALAAGDTTRGWAVLVVAVAHGASDAILELLLQHGADPSEPASRGLAPLHRAVQRAGNGADCRAAVRLLIDAGADPLAPDEDGLAPLHWAARVASAELFEQVLEAAASRGVPPSVLDQAVRSEHGAAKIEALLKRGAAPDGVHALALACGASTPDVALRLIDAGASVDQADVAGASPLHHAVAAGHESLVRALLERGAALDTKTRRAVADAEIRRGDTARDVAERRARYYHLLATEALVRAAVGRSLEVGPVASRHAATTEGAREAARAVCVRAGSSIEPALEDVTAPAGRDTLARLAASERIAALVGASLAPPPFRAHGTWKLVDVLDGNGPRRGSLALTEGGAFTAKLAGATIRGTYVASEDGIRLTTAAGPLEATFDGIQLMLMHGVTVFVFAPPAP